MGAPIGRLIIASNANNILQRFYRFGKYEKVNESVLYRDASCMETLGRKSYSNSLLIVFSSLNFLTVLKPSASFPLIWGFYRCQ